MTEPADEIKNCSIRLNQNAGRDEELLNLPEEIEGMLRDFGEDMMGFGHEELDQWNNLDLNQSLNLGNTEKERTEALAELRQQHQDWRPQLFKSPQMALECLYTNAYLSFAEEKLGVVVAVAYGTIPVLQLGIACNRAIAALLPSFYRRLYAGLFALIFIFGGVSYGATTQTDDIIRDCKFVYDRSQFSWNLVNCILELQDYKFFYPIFSITGVTVIINSAVAIKLVIQKAGGGDVTHNAKLFWQSLTQELFFVNDLIWQGVLSDLIDSKIWKFVSLTLMWELAHTLDG
ncbi:unnamed protein product [Cylicocyclus nassatus]|uniref:7TM GPCR serpentine receptor class x (Srx) domain-containing protein n=1 Tax=Cylicocyclus nassatus TaxID=53992 RepID=A0AA36GRX4_CYLNA|nr:unnamed protein product [Cylicocyclus nassatus]